MLIPKPEPMPRSIPTLRFQPMSSYPLYSSLVFHRSQAPISVAIKRHAQPRPLLTLHPQPRQHPSPAGLCTISIGGNGRPGPCRPIHPGNWKSTILERLSPSSTPFLVRTLFPHPFLFQHPWPLLSPVT